MTGNPGSGLLDWFQQWRNGSGYARPSGENRNQMDQLEKRHQEDSAYLKYQIQMKEKELDSLLNETDPDLGKVRALRGDIRTLRAEADKEQHQYELEAGNVSNGYAPGNAESGSSYGPTGGSGGMMGYGGGMGSYGPRQ